MRVTYQQILCAVDLSDASDRAIAYGIALAREFQAHLLICHCIDLPAPSIYGEAYLAPEEQLNRNIDYAGGWIAERMENSGVPWEPLLVVGHAADEINRVAQERSADISGRNQFEQLLAGGTSSTIRAAQSLIDQSKILTGPQQIEQPKGALHRIALLLRKERDQQVDTGRLVGVILVAKAC